MNDLDTLRPEVREAVHAINHGNGVFVDSDDSIGAEKWRIVLTELLRLAAENASMRAAWHDALLTGTGILKVERIDPATVMLPVEPQQEPTK